MENEIIESRLLTVKEFCDYVHIGETTARKLLSEPNCPFRFKIGSKIFINKKILDKWIDSNT